MRHLMSKLSTLPLTMKNWRLQSQLHLPWDRNNCWKTRRWRTIYSNLEVSVLLSEITYYILDFSDEHHPSFNETAAGAVLSYISMIFLAFTTQKFHQWMFFVFCLLLQDECRQIYSKRINSKRAYGWMPNILQKEPSEERRDERKEESKTMRTVLLENFVYCQQKKW